MKCCAEVDALVTPFVDGEAPPAAHHDVATHVEACPSCLRRVGAEQTVREVVRTQGTSLISVAPAVLRARCEASRRPLMRPPALAVARRASWPLALAATFVLSVAGALVYSAFIDPAVATAAQLTLDHLKCFALFDQPGTVEPADVRARLKADYGWDVDIPPRQDGGDLQLVGGRRCVYVDGLLVHLLYRKAGAHVSMFILPRGQTAPRDLEIVGYSMVAFERRGRTWVVLAHQPGTDLQQMARRLGSDDKDSSQ